MGNDELNGILSDFWNWAGYDAEYYDRFGAADDEVEPFYYPHFEKLCGACISMINKDMSDPQWDAFLICLALDEEEESILDSCKQIAKPWFLERMAQHGINHPQSKARWQLAELLRCRSCTGRLEFLKQLCVDQHSYVRKRANNAIIDLDYV